MEITGHGTDGTPRGCTAPGCVAALARGDRWLGPSMSVDAAGRCTFHHTDELHAAVAAATAAEFAAAAAALTERPDDVVAAWRYLQLHPVFHRAEHPSWSTRTADELTADELTATTDPRRLVDDDGLRDLWVNIVRAEPPHPAAPPGPVEVWLEHGPHLWVSEIDPRHRGLYPANGTSTHDPALDVVAPTYEEALVALAAAVRAVYGDDRSRIGARFGAGFGSGEPEPPKS